MVLEKLGFQPLFAENGKEGLDIYNAQFPNISLVLADVSMPVMSGIEMVTQMFAVHADSNVILMTGFAAEYAVPVNLQQICATIDKPFTPQALLDVVTKRLKSKSSFARPPNHSHLNP